MTLKNVTVPLALQFAFDASCRALALPSEPPMLAGPLVGGPSRRPPAEMGIMTEAPSRHVPKSSQLSKSLVNLPAQLVC